MDSQVLAMSVLGTLHLCGIFFALEYGCCALIHNLTYELDHGK